MLFCLYDLVGTVVWGVVKQGKVAIMQEALGLDIGGANLKGATSQGQAVTLPFPLWKQPDKLTGGIIELLLRLSVNGPIAVTMTGELCDCFESKAAGVRHILSAVQEAVKDQPLFIWRNDGKWAGVQHAMDDPMPVASANWLASATYAGRYLPDGLGWFFDLGSTTLDMIPLLDGKPVPRGRTDLQRLRAGELAYLGVARTPVTSLVQYLDVEHESVTVAAEFFATIDDVLLILEYAQEDSHDQNTADGQPRTRGHAEKRLSRMVCAEVEELGKKNLLAISKQIMDVYRRKLSSHMRFSHARSQSQLGHKWGGVILAGSGEGILAEHVTDFANMGTTTSPVVSMTGRVGPEASTALAAYSLAVLLAERQAR